MPKPVCRHSRPVKPQSLAPIPQPISFDKMAAITISTANSTIIQLISGSSTFRPMLAKKIGVRNKYCTG